MPDRRLQFSIFFGRCAAIACRCLGRTATSLPGRLALMLDPNLIDKLGSRLQRVVMVTGTNGKTTTSNLIARVLERAGLLVINNREGANMACGIASVLLARHRDLDRHNAVAVLEVDEGSLDRVLAQLPANLVVTTNLFRDQLDRYHEIDQICARIAAALTRAPDAELLLNADDPVVVLLGRGRSRVRYFGLERTPDSRDGAPEALDGHICPDCQSPLEFVFSHYSHLGDYRCRSCGWKRPDRDFCALNLSRKDASAFTIRHNRGEMGLTSPLQGVHNCYNVLAAASAALLMEVSEEIIGREVSRFQPGQGRAEKFVVAGKQVTLQLVKNPTGLTEVLRATRFQNPAACVLAINDLDADGKDVSWLWDGDYLPLLAAGIDRFVCTGLRRWDVAVCLKYQGIDPAAIEVVEDRKKGLRRLLEAPVQDIVILCTYTNLAAFGRLIGELGGKSEASHLSPVSATP